MKPLIRTGIVRRIFKKEIKQLFRDQRMRFVLFFPPVIMLIIFGYAATTDVKNVSMAILDQDRSRQSRFVIERFTGSGYFIPVVYLKSPGELTELMDRGEIELFIHIEKGFSRRISAGRSSAIQIITDGTDSSRAAIVVSYVNEIISAFSFAEFNRRIRANLVNRAALSPAGGDAPDGIIPRLKKPILLKERVFYNPELTSRNFFLPGVLAMLGSLLTVVLTSMSIVKEREMGTIEQIIVSPIKPLEYIVGKTMPVAIVGCVDIAIISIIAIAWFDVPFNGSPVFLLFCSAIFIICMISIGLFISTISRTQQQSILSTFLFFMPVLLLSGFMFPVYAMPAAMKVIAYINPLTYFLKIIRGIFLKGAGMMILWQEVLVLMAMAAVMLRLSVSRFKRSME